MSLPPLDPFFGGAIFMGEFAIALLFWRLWRRTGERLFAWFATAFAILTFERLLLLTVLGSHGHPMIYTTRLIAFLAIAFAVIDHNRQTR